ncbi:MAG: prephenate dehydrogenase/arogenate dehydrogenase family protein [Chloroflexota bacterium]
MQVAFIGFGLIGGSIARAIRSNPGTKNWPLSAWSPSGEGPRQALADGVIDVAGNKPEAILPDADLVVLAGPATSVLPLIDKLAGRWRRVLRPDAIVTDVASTKARIVERADATGLWFVGGHPMAGRERGGYVASDADLFVDRPWVIIPGALAGANDIERVIDLVAACRAQVVTMDAVVHDRAVAGISHLPLVAAAAMVEAVANGTGPTRKGAKARKDWSVAADLAAGGWRDATRVALGEPAMGAAIAVTNAPELAARLRDYRNVLDAWLAELERPGGPDEAALTQRLSTARAILDGS